MGYYVIGIVEFVQKYKKGAHIVFGIRNDRNTDAFYKRFTAIAFYKLMNIMGVKITQNQYLKAIKEDEKFLDFFD